VYAAAGALTSFAATITDAVVARCRSAGSGGGLAFVFASVALRGVHASNCSVGASGGGAFLYGCVSALSARSLASYRRKVNAETEDVVRWLAAYDKAGGKPFAYEPGVGAGADAGAGSGAGAAAEGAGRLGAAAEAAFAPLATNNPKHAASAALPARVGLPPAAGTS
jgi:hypothetical protein